jgi:hypothetical protein
LGIEQREHMTIQGTVASDMRILPEFTVGAAIRALEFVEPGLNFDWSRKKWSPCPISPDQ